MKSFYFLLCVVVLSLLASCATKPPSSRVLYLEVGGLKAEMECTGDTCTLPPAIAGVFGKAVYEDQRVKEGEIAERQKAKQSQPQPFSSASVDSGLAEAEALLKQSILRRAANETVPAED